MQQDPTWHRKTRSYVYVMAKLGHDTYLEGQKVAGTEREILLDTSLILKLF